MLRKKAKSKEPVRFAETVPVGERNEVAFRTACKLRDMDWPIDLAEHVMRQQWQTFDQPGGDEYPEADALEILDRAYKTYGPGVDLINAGIQFSEKFNGTDTDRDNNKANEDADAATLTRRRRA